MSGRRKGGPDRPRRLQHAQDRESDRLAAHKLRPAHEGRRASWASEHERLLIRKLSKQNKRRRLVTERGKSNSHAKVIAVMVAHTVPKTIALEAQAATNGFLLDHLPHCFTAGHPTFDQAAQVWRVPVLSP